MTINLPPSENFIDSCEDTVYYGEMLVIKSCYDEQMWAAKRELRNSRMTWLCGRSYVDINLIVFESATSQTPIEFEDK
jgi:hypothetical protein